MCIKSATNLKQSAEALLVIHSYRCLAFLHSHSHYSRFICIKFCAQQSMPMDMIPCGLHDFVQLLYTVTALVKLVQCSSTNWS